mgnify:CR=1 FL=1
MNNCACVYKLVLHEKHLDQGGREATASDTPATRRSTGLFDGLKPVRLYKEHHKTVYIDHLRHNKARKALLAAAPHAGGACIRVLRSTSRSRSTHSTSPSVCLFVPHSTQTTSQPSSRPPPQRELPQAPTIRLAKNRCRHLATSRDPLECGSFPSFWRWPHSLYLQSSVLGLDLRGRR